MDSNTEPKAVEIQRELKTCEARVTQGNGNIYVYTRTYYYDERLHKNVDVSRKLEYKIVNGVKQPTRPKASSGSKSCKKNDGCTEENDSISVEYNRVGANELCDFIGKKSGIDQDLFDVFSDVGMSQKAISIARFWLCTGGHSLPFIQEWQLNHKLPYKDGITEDIYHKLFEDIGLDFKTVQKYFKKRIEWCDCALLVACDSSPISTYSVNIGYATFGYDHDNGDNLPQISVVILYAISKRQPIAYARVPGNTPDAITVVNAIVQLQALGVAIWRIITDCGYYHENNVAEFLMRGIHFQTRVKDNLKWVRKLVDENYRKLGRPSSFCDNKSIISGITVPVERTWTWTCTTENKIDGYQIGDEVQITKPLYLVILQDTERKTKLDQSLRTLAADLIERLNNGVEVKALDSAETRFMNKFLLRQITSTPGVYAYRMNNSTIQRQCRYHGITTLLLDDVEDEIPNRTIAAYGFSNMVLRERVEECFRKLKGQVDGNRTRVESDQVFDGRLFVEFVALGYEDYAYERLRIVKQHVNHFVSNYPKGTDAEVLRVYRSLKQWLHDMSLERIMYWFDLKEETIINFKGKEHKMYTSSVKRDKLFVTLFMDETLSVD